MSEFRIQRSEFCIRIQRSELGLAVNVEVNVSEVNAVGRLKRRSVAGFVRVCLRVK